MEFALFILFLIVIGLIIYYLAPWRIQIVPEEERWVIHRLGRFSRIVGPGVVRMSQLETIHHKFNAIDRPRNVRIDGLFMRGVPFGYTLNFWYRVDPVAAADGNQETLVQLSHFDDKERDKLVGTKVREALVASATQVGNEYQPAGEAYFYNMLPIVPGLPINDRLLTLVRDHLAQTLPTIGVLLNQAHPITIVGLNISDDLIGSFSRERIATLLREQFPSLSEEIRLEAVGAIAGIDMGRTRISVENSGNASVAVDDQGGARIFMGGSPRSAPTSSAAARPDRPPVAPPAAAPAETLSSDDLRVLKRVK